jgi:hypothetical protein
MTLGFIQGETIQEGKLFKGGHNQGGNYPRHFRIEKGFDRGHYSRRYII